MSHDIYTKIWTLDIDKIKPEVLEGFESGLVELRRGVAYWSKMSGKNGIVQHIRSLNQSKWHKMLLH